MSEHKFTPGPWRVSGLLRYVLALKTKTVCEVPCGGARLANVDIANAQLMAAAPDLLAACEALVERYESLVHSDYDGCNALEPLLADAAHARAAIAKALGTQVTP